MKRFRLRAVTAVFTAVCCLLAGCGLADIGREDESLKYESVEGIPEWTGTDGSVFSEEDTDPGDNAPDAGGKEGESPLFEEAHVSDYAYNTLSDAEKVWYRDINATLGNMLTEQKLSEACFKEGLDETSIDRVFQCVLNDHPEYFYVEGYTYTKYTQMDKLIKLVFSGTYSMELEEAGERRLRILSAVERLLEGISGEDNEYEKVKYVYETLICNTDYDLTAPDNQNIYSVFVNHASVCQGYAKAAQYLLNRLEVECTLVLGTVDTGEGHAWNLVKVNGDYYYMDTTWGDASYQAEGETAVMMPEINYDYLCVTTEQILRTHTLGGEMPMPECSALDANYFVREGAYFTGFNEEQMRNVFDEAARQGRSDVTIKCENDAVYKVIEQRLLGDHEIFDYLKHDGGQIAYAQNIKQLSLTFWVTND